MLTARGWWFLVVVATLLVPGVTVLPAFTVAPALLGLTLLGWFAVEWVLFQFRLNATAARLQMRRRVIQGGRDVPTVWAGLSFEVQVEVWHDGTARLPLVAFSDRLPQATDRGSGENEIAGGLRPGESVSLTYTLRAPAPGVLRFEGVRVRIADLHGFFLHQAFLRDAAEFLILPPLTDDEGRRRADKRFNTLPPPGIHRIRRPGSGGELLDLRDYRPGDPPKMIAWKASARRDRLITKEYENDVPVRCVLFLDVSEGMRLGPPAQTPLTRLAAVASGVAQAAAGNRDLIGLTTFDESAFSAIRPARTKRHLIDVLRRLAEVSALQPGAAGVPAEQLTRLAYPLARELYPELMTQRVNTVPLGRLWRPLLDRRFGWLLPAAMFAGPLLILIAYLGKVAPLLGLALKWVKLVSEVAASLTPQSWFWGVKLAWFLGLLLVLLVLPIVLGLAYWVFHGTRGWYGKRRTQLVQRKQLAAVLALQDGTGPAGIENLIHDDAAYADRVGRFLQEQQVRVPVPLYDDRGRYRFRCPAKAQVLADALTAATRQARDNELYVILADLAELGPDLDPVLKAAKLARSKHHQVTAIVPWPADMPPPETEVNPMAAGSSDAASLQARRVAVVRDVLTAQHREAFQALRQSFGRIGATVVRVDESDPVQLILDRLDRLRGVRSRR